MTANRVLIAGDCGSGFAAALVASIRAAGHVVVTEAPPRPGEVGQFDGMSIVRNIAVPPPAHRAHVAISPEIAAWNRRIEERKATKRARKVRP